MQGLHTPPLVISMQGLPTPTSVISMQGPPTPTEDDEGPNLKRTVIVRRRAAKRTLPWYLPADDLELVSTPQAEDTPATKRPHLEKPFSASTDEATTKNNPYDTKVAPPLAAAAGSDLLRIGEAAPVAESTSEEGLPPQQQPTSVDGDASLQNSGVPPRQQPQYPMQPQPQPPQQQMQMPYGMPPQGNHYGDYYGGQMRMHPSQQRDPTGPHPSYHPGHYMPPQQMPGPGMYQRQMYPGMPPYPGMPNMPPNMVLGPSGMPYYPGQGGQMPYPPHGYEDDARATGALEEDAKLTNVGMNNSEKKWGKENRTDWAAATVLDMGQTLHSSIDRTNGRTGKWTPDEDNKLKDAVPMYNGNDWTAIAALVPGRTRNQCWHRWRDVLNPSINRANRCTGSWTPDEDTKLKTAVQMHVRNDWEAIARLIPRRTNTQCRDRWRKHLNLRSAQTAERAGNWTPDEDTKLKDAVHIHGGKNWDAIARLVPGRTKKQCCGRWHK
jgi:hypothetical protein